VKPQPVETPHEWVARFMRDIPPASITDEMEKAIIEYRKSTFISEAIIEAINGTPIPPDVSLRETSFLFALVTNGGNILDVIEMVKVGLLSQDCLSTFGTLKKTWEEKNGD
jgi:hypothetical protein